MMRIMIMLPLLVVGGVWRWRWSWRRICVGSSSKHHCRRCHLHQRPTQPRAAAASRALSIDYGRIKGSVFSAAFRAHPVPTVWMHLIDASFFSAALDLRRANCLEPAALKWSLFQIFDVTIVMDGAALKVVCFMSWGRPQGGRTVIIHYNIHIVGIIDCGIDKYWRQCSERGKHFGHFFGVCKCSGRLHSPLGILSRTLSSWLHWQKIDIWPWL